MVSFSTLNIMFDSVAAILLTMMYISIVNDKNKRRHNLYFNFSVLFSVIYCILDLLFNLFNGKRQHETAALVIEVISFVLVYYIVALASGYLLNVVNVERNRKRSLLIFYLIGAILWAIGLIVFVSYGEVFGVENGYYVRYENWPYAVTYPLVCMLTNCCIILFSKAKMITRLSFAMFCIIPSIGVFISYFDINFPLMSILLTVSLQLLYINIYVERSIQLYQNNIELEIRRTESMISQIQPHFLYNCITTCVALCRIDPEKAAETMTDFGKYLRGNLDTFKQKKPIPFTKELDHINVYLNLEKVRFDEKLNIEYNIGVVDFYVPALSVQPLVENAVKHGISLSENGGTVKISTSEDKDYYYIEVWDNGTGFDINVMPNDERSHIGIENVNKRLHLMMDATLKIESKIGEGTLATVIIPKRNKGVNI